MAFSALSRFAPKTQARRNRGCYNSLNSMPFWSDTYSVGRPTEVVQHLLRYLQDDLTATEAEQRAREIVEAIPDLVPEPKEWFWHRRILWDRNEEARGIMLTASKSKHRWTSRIRLPRNST